MARAQIIVPGTAKNVSCTVWPHRDGKTATVVLTAEEWSRGKRVARVLYKSVVALGETLTSTEAVWSLIGRVAADQQLPG